MTFWDWALSSAARLGVFLGLVGVTVWLCALSYKRSGISRRKRWAVLTIVFRTVAVAMVLLCILAPKYYRKEKLMQRQKVVAVIDMSDSMDIEDGPGGTARLDAVAKALRAHASRLKDLEERFDVEAMGVGRTTKVFSDALPVSGRLDRPAGLRTDATWLSAGLRRALREARETPTAAILLFSDGACNYGQDPASVAKLAARAGVKIFAVGVGETVAAKRAADVAVNAIRCGRRIFRGNLLPVIAECSFFGCAGKQVDLSLWIDERKISQRTVALSTDNEARRVTFEPRMDKTGRFKITVMAEPLEGESLVKNNSASTFVDVVSGGLRVAYFEGKLRPEYKFLKRALATMPGVSLTARLLLGGRGAPLNPAWARYHVIILGDVPASRFSSASLRSLRDACERRGVGLLMIGGLQTFGAGGYGRSPLASLLPVAVTPGDGQYDQPFRVQPTAAGLAHYVLRLKGDAKENRHVWRSLPTVIGASKFHAVKPGAAMLARGPNGMPVLVVHTVGRGRCAAFGVDSTWRWVLAEKDFSKEHRRFWRQLVLWLASRDKLGAEGVTLHLPKYRLAVGETTEWTVRVFDAAGEPVAVDRLDVNVADPNSRTTALFGAFDTEAYHGEWRPTVEGDHEFTVAAFLGHKLVGKDSAQVSVYTRFLEMEPPLSDFGLLKRLAKIGGGEFVPLSACGQVIDSLLEQPPGKVVTRQVWVSLWDRPVIFWIFLAALCGEWIVRKRLGLP